MIIDFYKGNGGGGGGTVGPQGNIGPQGPQGERGADGTSVEIKPSKAECVEIGDGYIDDNGHLNIRIGDGPNDFQDVGEIRGPQGLTGPAGANGADGATGAQGPKGDTGDQGPAGADGADGATGAQGPKGDTGDQGPAGADGNDGATGPQGPKGDTGDQGPAGADGADGATGPQGPKGDTGDTGPQGPAGGAGSKIELMSMTPQEQYQFYQDVYGGTLTDVSNYTANGFPLINAYPANSGWVVLDNDGNDYTTDGTEIVLLMNLMYNGNYDNPYFAFYATLFSPSIVQTYGSTIDLGLTTKAVSGTNDGTNWLTLTVGSDTYAIPQGGGGGATGPQGETGPQGATGAQGPQGETGQQGATGAQGPAGGAGSKIELMTLTPQEQMAFYQDVLNGTIEDFSNYTANGYPLVNAHGIFYIGQEIPVSSGETYTTDGTELVLLLNPMVSNMYVDTTVADGKAMDMVYYVTLFSPTIVQSYGGPLDFGMDLYSNRQADWNTATATDPSFIKNKPTTVSLTFTFSDNTTATYNIYGALQNNA